MRAGWAEPDLENILPVLKLLTQHALPLHFHDQKFFLKIFLKHKVVTKEPAPFAFFTQLLETVQFSFIKCIFICLLFLTKALIIGL